MTPAALRSLRPGDIVFARDERLGWCKATVLHAVVERASNPSKRIVAGSDYAVWVRMDYNDEAVSCGPSEIKEAGVVDRIASLEKKP
mgnify:CR=1 FL=1